jgi:flagellar hook-associated protein 1
MTIDALNTALSGLNITKAQIDLVSRNVANANTDGYTRKTATQTTSAIGQVALGNVLRNVSEPLNQALRDATSDASAAGVTVDLLSRVETVLGSPDANSSLSGMIGKLQSAFQDLSANPEQPSGYGAVVNAADGVARAFRTLYSTAEAVRGDADLQLDQGVNDFNQALDQIKALNNQIISHVGVSDTSDLQDQRDQLLSKLAQFGDVTVIRRNDAVAVYTPNGVPLLDGEVFPVSRDATGALQQSTPPSAPVPVNFRSGSLPALLTMRDTTMPALQTQLDDVARALTASFDGIDVPLFNDNGGTPLDTTNAAQLDGYAARISVNDQIRANPSWLHDTATGPVLQAGDTTNIDAAKAIFASTTIGFSAAGLPATGSLLQAATNIVAGQGNARADAQSKSDVATSLQDSLAEKVSSLGGVKIDDEVARLSALQETYAANAHVVQTLKEMYDTLFQAVS